MIRSISIPRVATVWKNVIVGAILASTFLSELQLVKWSKNYYVEAAKTCLTDPRDVIFTTRQNKYNLS